MPKGWSHVKQHDIEIVFCAYRCDWKLTESKATISMPFILCTGRVFIFNKMTRQSMGIVTLIYPDRLSHCYYLEMDTWEKGNNSVSCESTVNTKSRNRKSVEDSVQDKILAKSDHGVWYTYISQHVWFFMCLRKESRWRLCDFALTLKRVEVRLSHTFRTFPYPAKVTCRMLTFLGIRIQSEAAFSTVATGGGRMKAGSWMNHSC